MSYEPTRSNTAQHRIFGQPDSSALPEKHGLKTILTPTPQPSMFSVVTVTLTFADPSNWSPGNYLWGVSAVDNAGNIWDLQSPLIVTSDGQTSITNIQATCRTQGAVQLGANQINYTLYAQNAYGVYPPQTYAVWTITNGGNTATPGSFLGGSGATYPTGDQIDIGRGALNTRTYMQTFLNVLNIGTTPPPARN